MKLKKQSEFTETEREHFVAELSTDISFKGKELKLEVTSSSKALLESQVMKFFTQTCIWDGDNLIYNNIYHMPLTASQCFEICNNIGESPEKYLN